MTTPAFPVPPVGGEGNPLGINEEGDAARREGEEQEEASEEPTVIGLDESEKAARGERTAPDDE